MIPSSALLHNGFLRRIVGQTSAVRLLAAPMLALVLFPTGGCSARRVRADFHGFEMAFAETSNHELLLNLARLQNHDPTYFFKMGQINSAYRMVASVPTSVGFASQSTILNKSNTTGGATPLLSYENDPTFQFIPVDDATNAQLLLKQIPPETFYILYQQGWRIDQLLRLMIDRIEVTGYVNNKCVVSTYRNVPPPVFNSATGVVSADEQQLSGYTTFLRIAAIAYGLQKHGDLLLRGVSNFVPLDEKAVTIYPASSGKDPNAPPPEPGVTADIVEKAAEKNLSFEQAKPAGIPKPGSLTPSPSAILIGQRTISPKFYLIPPDPNTSTDEEYAPDTKGIIQQIGEDPRLKKWLQNSIVLTAFINALQDGLTISGDSTTQKQAANPCPVDRKKSSVQLVSRSLIGVMAAAAQEQKIFDILDERNVMLFQDPGTPQLTFDQAVPDIERLPLLRIDWRPDTLPNAPPATVHYQPTKPLVETRYREHDYLIADPRPDANMLPENEYWNRDVFRLISALTAQVTVDVSKYPVPDILQIRNQ